MTNISHQDQALSKGRRQLHELRSKVGACTAFGRRISHAIETMGNCLTAPPEDRSILLRSLAAQLSGIEQHRAGVPLIDTRSRMPQQITKADVLTYT